MRLFYSFPYYLIPFVYDQSLWISTLKWWESRYTCRRNSPIHATRILLDDSRVDSLWCNSILCIDGYYALYAHIFKRALLATHLPRTWSRYRALLAHKQDECECSGWTLSPLLICHWTDSLRHICDVQTRLDSFYIWGFGPHIWSYELLWILHKKRSDGDRYSCILWAHRSYHRWTHKHVDRELNGKHYYSNHRSYRVHSTHRIRYTEDQKHEYNR